MDYIDIKIRFRADNPILFTKLLSTNKRHRANMIRTYVIIGLAAINDLRADVPAMADLSNANLGSSPPPDKTRTKTRNVSIEGGKDGIQVSEDEYTEIGDGLEIILKNS